MSTAERLERLVLGTPLEPIARRAWGLLRSIGRPRVRQSRRYDAQTREILRRALEPTSNCVDIGAHKGSFLSDVLRVAPHGTHYAFEPLPELAADLARRFPGVHVHPVALSDVEGERTFCRVTSSPGLSGFRRMGHVPPGDPVEWITVPTARLDDVLPPALRVDLIKIDVEGAQYEVLRGGAERIARDRPLIVFEHGKLAEESYGTTSDSVYDLLTDLGLRLSLLRGWLEGEKPLEREEFCSHVGFHRTSEFCFIAHPPVAGAARPG